MRVSTPSTGGGGMRSTRSLRAGALGPARAARCDCESTRSCSSFGVAPLPRVAARRALRRAGTDDRADARLQTRVDAAPCRWSRGNRRAPSPDLRRSSTRSPAGVRELLAHDGRIFRMQVDAHVARRRRQQRHGLANDRDHLRRIDAQLTTHQLLRDGQRQAARADLRPASSSCSGCASVPIMASSVATCTSLQLMSLRRFRASPRARLGVTLRVRLLLARARRLRAADVAPGAARLHRLARDRRQIPARRPALITEFLTLAAELDRAGFGHLADHGRISFCAASTSDRRTGPAPRDRPSAFRPHAATCS